jgi:hypothetical protein
MVSSPAKDDSEQSFDEVEPSLVIVFDDQRHQLGSDHAMTFGRQADLIIDPANRSLHRVLGEFHSERATWYVTNHGRSTSLIVTDMDGASFARVVPGASVPLPFANSAVSFAAGRANYRLTAHMPVPPAQMPRDPNLRTIDVLDRESTITVSGLIFNEEQYQLLTVLAANRADGPVEPDNLPTNRQLARELGWSIHKLTRKLDNLCLKLHRAGVTGLVGDTADIARERRLRLATIAVEYNLVERTVVDEDPSP